MPGSLTTPGRTDARTNASVHVVFRKTEHVDTRDFQAFAAQWLAYVLPYRRFAVILADANARLGANADCYSFIAVDFHHLLFAGFYRRTGILEFSIGGPAKAVPKDSTGVVEAKALPIAEFGPHDLVAGQPRERGFMVAAHG
jgi:hypothetical protein